MKNIYDDYSDSLSISLIILLNKYKLWNKLIIILN